MSDGIKNQKELKENGKTIYPYEKLKPYEGHLYVKIHNIKNGKIEFKDLGKNLITANAKAIMTHLLAQEPSTKSGILNYVRYFDPINVNWNQNTGGTQGSEINGQNFSPTPEDLKISYMAFGTNRNDDDTGNGLSTDILQFGLYNCVDKSGNKHSSGSLSNDVNNILYGGTTTRYEYLQSTDSNSIDDAILNIIVRMATGEGQPTGGSVIYREAGLFTTPFYQNNNQTFPLMIARKVFPEITKTEDVELEFVWQIRF
jgi:hypothetical protein